MSINGRPSSLGSLIATLSRNTASLAARKSLNGFIAREEQNTFSARLRLAVKDNIATLPDHGGPTTCASGILDTHNSPFEATIVSQLRARGATVVGKTNLDEFGMGSHSTNSFFGAVSQHTVTDDGELEEGSGRSVGGSSGGSAIAVRSGEADIALGTDTGGSIRLPAAYCGVVGYKPSYGMLSRHGVVPYANSLDTVGLLANSVLRIREHIVDDQLLGDERGLWREHDPLDPTSLPVSARARCAAVRVGYYDSAGGYHGGPLGSLTFGIPVEYNIEELDPRILAALLDLAETLRRKLGTRVEAVSLPSTRHALSAYYVIAPAEASSNLAKYDGVRYGNRSRKEVSDVDGDSSTSTDGADGVLYSKTRGEGFGEEVKRRILLGSYTLSSEAMDNYFVKAQKVRQLVRRDFDRVFKLSNPLRDEEEQQFSLTDMDEDIMLQNKLGPAQVDFLLCPTAPTLAPKLEEVMRQTPLDSFMNDVFTVPASLAGLPAISIPMKLGKSKDDDGQEQDVAGLQIIGQYWDDANLLSVAQALSEHLTFDS